jgi:hypothetical protein
MTTELAPIERAKKVLSYDETKARLAELAAKSERIVEITNAPGYQEAHRARMDLKNARVDIQKRGKDARADATAFSKAVIAAEGELVGVIEPEESRLQALQDTWDAAREAERQAKIEAERQRVETIQRRVSRIREAHLYVGGDMGLMRAEIEGLATITIGEDFQEFQPVAEAARTEALTKLQAMLAEAEERAAREASEADARRIEAEQIAKERAEVDRQRAELEAQRQAAAAEQARIEADHRAKVEAQQAELRVQQEAAAKAQAESEAAQRAAEEAQRKAEEDARRAELERQREADRVAIEAAEAQAEAARQQAAEAAAARIAADIASATLREAAEEAVGLLTELGEGDHITTRKLAAALARDEGDAA